jgi:uncharacterized peroxidase-related enzyme
MAHIDLGSEPAPGIVGLLAYRPETGRILSELAEELLRAPGSLPAGERELIAAYVSTLNACEFCGNSHGATAAAQLPGGAALVDQVRVDPDTAPIPDKLRALLHIAEAVKIGGREVTGALVDAARQQGATDTEIHDTVLIAAAFCMYNRYVDGLATATPGDPARYDDAAARLVAGGYLEAVTTPR